MLSRYGSQHDDDSLRLIIDSKCSCEASSSSVSDSSFYAYHTVFLQELVSVAPEDGLGNHLAFLKELEAALVAHCLDDSPEDFALHGLPTHEIDILAAAVVVDVVEAVRVGEPSLEHVEAPALAVHEVNEFLCIEFNALVIFSEVNTSNL